MNKYVTLPILLIKTICLAGNKNTQNILKNEYTFSLKNVLNVNKADFTTNTVYTTAAILSLKGLSSIIPGALARTFFCLRGWRQVTINIISHLMPHSILSAPLSLPLLRAALLIFPPLYHMAASTLA